MARVLPCRALSSGPSATAHAARPRSGSRMTTLNRSPPSGPFYSSTRPGAPLTPTLNTHPTPLRVRDRPESSNPDAAPLAPPYRAPHNFAVPPPPSGALAPPRLELFGLPAGPPGPVPTALQPPPPPPSAPVLATKSLGYGPLNSSPPHQLSSSLSNPAAAAPAPLTLCNSQVLTLANQNPPPATRRS